MLRIIRTVGSSLVLVGLLLALIALASMVLSAVYLFVSTVFSFLSPIPWMPIFVVMGIGYLMLFVPVGLSKISNQ